MSFSAILAEKVEWNPDRRLYINWKLMLGHNLIQELFSNIGWKGEAKCVLIRAKIQLESTLKEMGAL